MIRLLLLFLAITFSTTAATRPLVIWHGLGDSYASPGIREFMARIEDIYPGIFIHSVYINQDVEQDRRATFYGNVNEQVQLAAEQLGAIPQLQNGFDAVGFSQGGQFIRAYVERYNQPPVNNLITFGSQHMGISDLPVCNAYDFLCELARRAAKSAVYGEWVQSNLVQAQYFRDPSNYEKYLSSNHFLASINNEAKGSRNATYADQLASLNQLVLIMFTEDKTVVPKESSWFGTESEDSKGDQAVLSEIKGTVPMRRQQLYTEDWIGLRRLDERGGVVLEECEGGHMQIGGCWERILLGRVGGD